MNFAICDDNKEYCEIIKKQVKSYFKSEKLCPNIDIFYSGEDLLSSSSTYDIVFLDVEMSGISGIHTGHKLSKKDPHVIFILITAYDNYIDEAFKLNAFRYISKPLNETRFHRCLEDALIYQAANNKKVAIETKNDVITVSISDIIMVVSNKRYSTIYTTIGVFESRNNISYWETTLESSTFFRTHKSYLVNLKHVTRFSKDTIYTQYDKIEAYLTQRKYVEFKKSYLMYLSLNP